MVVYRRNRDVHNRRCAFRRSVIVLGSIGDHDRKGIRTRKIPVRYVDNLTLRIVAQGYLTVAGCAREGPGQITEKSFRIIDVEKRRNPTRWKIFGHGNRKSIRGKDRRVIQYVNAEAKTLGNLEAVPIGQEHRHLA